MKSASSMVEVFPYRFWNRVQRIGNDQELRPYVIAMLFVISLRLHAGSRRNCAAQVESEKIDDVAFVLDEQNCVAACRFHSPILSPRLFQLVSEAFGRLIV